MIPTRIQCLELIERYEMLPHIVRHSERVTQVALFIASRLNRGGLELDLPLIEAAALLHDIAKTICLSTKENHATAGGDLLHSLGYPAVATIVRQHIRLDKGAAIDATVVTEVELVNYADKRVKHEEVVDLEERFRDIRERYLGKFAHLDEALDEVFAETRRIEEKIFARIGMSPEQLVHFLFER